MTLYFKFSLFWCLVALTYGYILGVILVKVLNISTKVGIYISEVVDELQTELGTSGDYVDSGYSSDGDND